MNENSNVFPLRQPGNIDDPLTDILRSGARRLLAQAIHLEAETFLETMKDFKFADGRDRVVRHGHAPKLVGRPARASGFGSTRRFSPFGHDAGGASIRCCRCSTAGHFDGGFPGSPVGAAGRGGAQPVACGDLQTDGRMEGGVYALEEA
jgi:hypothetical protein